MYHANLGGAYVTLTRWNEAVEAYLNATEIEPSNAEYQNRLGGAYFGAGDYNKAAGHFQKAIALKPDSQLYISDLIKTVEKIANPVARVSLLESALSYAPENIELKHAIENLRN